MLHADVTSCILTLPVVFEEQKRECIRRAAELGGFRASEIRTIDEPVAAARAWLRGHGREIADSVIVCDVGGGTTDFALLRHVHGDFEPVPELANDGLSLGGNDVDESILEESLSQYPAAKPWERFRSGLLGKVRILKERIAWDRNTSFPIRLQHAAFAIPREVVESHSRAFIEQITGQMNRFLGRCGAKADIQRVPILLVGGASRLNGLKEALEKLAPGGVYQWNLCDFAVVLGAVECPPTPDPQQVAGPQETAIPPAASVDPIVPLDETVPPAAASLQSGCPVQSASAGSILTPAITPAERVGAEAVPDQDDAPPLSLQMDLTAHESLSKELAKLNELIKRRSDDAAAAGLAASCVLWLLLSGVIAIAGAFGFALGGPVPGIIFFLTIGAVIAWGMASSRSSNQRLIIREQHRIWDVAKRANISNEKLNTMIREHKELAEYWSL